MFMNKNTEVWLDTIGGTNAKQKLNAAMDALTQKAESNNMIYKEENKMTKGEILETEVVEVEEPVEIVEKPTAELLNETEEKSDSQEEPVEIVEKPTAELLNETEEKSDSQEEPVEEVETTSVPEVSETLTKMLNDNFSQVADMFVKMQEQIDALSEKVVELSAQTVETKEASFVEVPSLSFSAIFNERVNKSQTSEITKMADELLKESPEESDPEQVNDASGIVPFIAF